MTISEFDKYFTHVSKGGYSTCIHDSDLKDKGITEMWDGSTMPNCVGLAWGFFNLERGTKKSFKRLSGNAGTLYAQAKKNGSGFWASNQVKEHAIAVYGAGTAAGHVLYIWRKEADGDYICFESNYSGNAINDKNFRIIRTKNPKTLYKEWKGCIYDFT